MFDPSIGDSFLSYTPKPGPEHKSAPIASEKQKINAAVSTALQKFTSTRAADRVKMNMTAAHIKEDDARINRAYVIVWIEVDKESKFNDFFGTLYMVKHRIDVLRYETKCFDEKNGYLEQRKNDQVEMAEQKRELDHLDFDS